MLLFERMWIFELWIWNSVECFKWGLMGHPSRNMEDGGAEGDLNCVGLLAQKFQWKRMLVSSAYCFCDIWTKNMAAFCHCSKSLPETK